MRHLVLIGDGMADFPLPNHGGRTPLELADTPALDTVVQRGLIGLFCPIPDGLPPGSDIGNLSLFGYDPRRTFTGRAPLEAARQGIPLGPTDVAFRCNLVTLQDGRMKSFTAQHISTAEALDIITDLHEAMAGLPVKFYPGVSYRHLAVISAEPTHVNDYIHTRCTPPHDITDRPYAPHLPSGPGAPLVLEIMRRSQPLLDNHRIARARIAAGKLPPTSVWLWGQGLPPVLQSYPTRFGITGAVISAVDLVKGIGVCAGLEVVEVPGATGYLDTNYEGKVHAALEALGRHDFAFVHIEAPDETSHEGSLELKVRAIEDFDRRVVAPCLEYLSTHAPCRLLVAADHITALSTKTHEAGPVPFAVCGTGVAVGRQTAFSERSAEQSGILLRHGFHLTPLLLTAAHIDAHTLNACAGLE